MTPNIRFLKSKYTHDGYGDDGSGLLLTIQMEKRRKAKEEADAIATAKFSKKLTKDFNKAKKAKEQTMMSIKDIKYIVQEEMKKYFYNETLSREAQQTAYQLYIDILTAIDKGATK